jgi:hypothetical protein
MAIMSKSSVTDTDIALAMTVIGTTVRITVVLTMGRIMLQVMATATAKEGTMGRAVALMTVPVRVAVTMIVALIIVVTRAAVSMTVVGRAVALMTAAVKVAVTMTVALMAVVGRVVAMVTGHTIMAVAKAAAKDCQEMAKHLFKTSQNQVGKKTKRPLQTGTATITHMNIVRMTEGVTVLPTSTTPLTPPL